MTPDEWNDRRLDDLAHQVRVVAALSTQVATQHADLSNLKDDVLEQRRAHEDAVRQFREALATIAKTCEEGTRRVEARIDARAAGKWTFWAAILGPTLTALIGAAALILTGGPS